MRLGRFFAMLVFAAQTPLAAQTGAMFSKNGWDGFLDVQYQGGDASQPKRKTGMLVLTDSALIFYDCPWDCEQDAKKRKDFWEAPAFRIAYRGITNAKASTGTADHAGLGMPLLFSDKSSDYITVVYESATSVESPVFKTKRAMAGAIEAKMRFRMKKLGLPEPKP